MSVVTSWITNIILIILFAVVLELLLPNSKMQRYVKLVVGLMLLMVMLQPLLSIFQVNPEDWLDEISTWETEQNISETSSLDSQKVDIEMDNLAYISEYMAVQLKKDAADDVEEQFEVVLSDVKVEFDEYKEIQDFQSEEKLLENLSGVYVLLKPISNSREDNNVDVVNIDPITIEKEDEAKKENKIDEHSLISNITTFLSELWVVPEEKLHVQMKGGEE